MQAISKKIVSIAGQRIGSPPMFRTLGPVLLLLGACVLTAFLVLARGVSASAWTAPKDQALGALDSPSCGPDWVVVNSPDPGSSANLLQAVAAVSSNDIWAVGYFVNGSSVQQSLIEHWNGSAWSVVPSSDLGTTTNYLYGVAAISSNDIWAVGYYVDNSQNEQTMTEHWDGSVWNIVSSPYLGRRLIGVAAIASNDVWAVGWSNDGTADRTLTQHWNGGTAWAVAPSPNVGSGDNHLDAVTAISSNDVWAVGHYSNSSGVSQTLTEHWNGATWSEMDSPNSGTGDNGLLGVDAIASNDVWATGYFKEGSIYQTLIENWNGSSWSVVSSYNFAGEDNVLYGVAALSANNVRTVGYYVNSSGMQQTLIEHWNGSQWTLVTSPNVGSASNGLVGVAALSANNVWAVGAYYNGTANQTLIERYNTCSGSPTPTPSPTATPPSCTLQFEDVPNPSTFYQYVQCLACRGIINGYACGGAGEPCDPNHNPYFRPNADVTRGQIAKIVALSAGVHSTVSGQTFQDVPPGSTFYTYTEQLYALGVMNGYACGGAGEPCVPPANRPYFRPNSNATRGQLAKIDANAAGYQDPPVGQSFEDIGVGSTFYTFTQRLTSRGVMSGYACGGAGEPCVPPANRPYFRPNSDVTRGQTSKIVANTFYPNCQTGGR